MRWLGLFAALVLLIPSAASAQYEEGTSSSYLWSVDSMDVEIEVRQDGSFRVDESILVDFDVEKHGIYRYVPYRYSKFGFRSVAGINDIVILQDGESAQFSQSGENGNLVWKIGDPNATITGKHAYEISYTVSDAVLFEDGYDELYWNVTGNDWEVPIDFATVTVTLPGNVEPLELGCWTGAYGSTARDCDIAFDEQSRTTIAAADDMLTIAVTFPKGIVDAPSTAEVVWKMIRDNVVAVIGLFLIPIPLILWFRHGRDVRVGAVGPEYEPPEGYSAAHLVAIQHGGRKHLIAAMVVTLAQQGYLRIIAEEKAGWFGKKETISLEKLQEGDALDAPHKALFVALFRQADEKGVVNLTGQRGLLQSHTVKRITDGLRHQWIEDGYYAEHSFRWQDAMIGVGIVGLVGGFMLIGWSENFGFITWSLAGAATVLAGYFIPRLTHKGAEFYRRVQGFRMFMHRAERYRSAWQEKQSMFTEYLPYAIAFGDVHRWAKAFEGTQAANAQPAWYLGHYSSWSYLHLARGMTSLENTVAAAMPSSSGGSGGSSGGGFGGGGGGSW